MPPTSIQVRGDESDSGERLVVPPPLADTVPLRSLIALRWRAHDRTHLELPVPVPVPQRASGARYTWEAYFFVPGSFRLNKNTYGKDSLDEDFKSYVRLAVPETRVSELEPAIVNIEAGLDRGDDAAVCALRLFVCRARRVFREELDRLEDQGEWSPGDAARLAAEVSAMLTRFRQVAMRADDGSEGELAVAVRWVDEDLSLNVESMLIRLTGWLENTTFESHEDERSERVQARIVELAVEEARYRRDVGYPAVVGGNGCVDPSSRDMERLEFRRHTLKRFTASILWLDTKAEDPARWAKHVLYAFAAGLAMTFAVLAAVWNGPIAGRGELGVWLVVAIVAYAVKDRIKASLQDVFAGVLSKRFADRRWRIRKRGGDEVGVMDERSGYAKFAELPEAVLAARRMTRQHAIEEEARPETVLWHQKTIAVEPGAVPEGHAGLLEIFRVDLRRWLVNTDEANNQVRFADPEQGRIDEVLAPRVYNIAVVYRLQTGNTDDSAEEPWRRTRVVVTRKGIRRIEQIV